LRAPALALLAALMGPEITYQLKQRFTFMGTIEELEI
jgi:hypothetical protein